MSKIAEKQKTDAIGDALHAIAAPALKSTAAKAPITRSELPAPSQKLSPPKPVAVPSGVARIKRTGQPARLQIKGYLHNSWDFTAERGTLVTDVLDPDFWKHTAGQFKPFDEVTVIAEDGAWKAYLTVAACDKQWARMFLEAHYDLTASYENMPKTQWEEFEICWTVMGKYGVRKKGNGGLPVLKDGFETQIDAYTWLDGHLKTLNG